MKWPKTHFQEFPHCNPHWKQPRCGVTGWTNFSAIFLFLLSNIHNLATIGTVAGVSDNFLIFWAALVGYSYCGILNFKKKLVEEWFSLTMKWFLKIATFDLFTTRPIWACEASWGYFASITCTTCGLLLSNYGLYVQQCTWLEHCSVETQRRQHWWQSVFWKLKTENHNHGLYVQRWVWL